MQDVSPTYILMSLLSPFSPTAVPTGMVAILQLLLLNGTSEQIAFRRYYEFENHLP